MVSAPGKLAAEQDWSHAGAHNVAGVSFQIAVTAKLLVSTLARNSGLRATPEGYEDIDLELGDGTRVLGPGEGTCPRSAFRALGACGRHSEEKDPSH